MNRSPWVLTITSVVVTLSLGFSNYVARVGVDSTPKWLRPIAEWFGELFGADVARWVLTFTVVGAVIPIADRLVGIHRFRKAKIQRLLDQAVAELLAGDARTHRLTLFKATRGWRLWLIFGYRIWRQDDKGSALRDIIKIRPAGLYLYVYARPKRAWNPHSCAVYRVYRNRDRDCDGIAGLVWQQDEITKRNLVVPGKPGELRKMKELETYPPDHAYRTYANETNVRTTQQLRAREHYGRHFHGTVIEDGAAEKWGVLLLDSMAVLCPIPESKKAADRGDAWMQRFDRYAETVSQLLT